MNHKKFKRIISISAAAVCMASAFRLIPVSDDTAVAADVMTAFEITADMEIGWNLGNTLDATNAKSDPGLSTETAWGNPKATQELISAVKAKGFNTIRIPTTWYQHMDEEGNIDADWLARVKEVVDYAYNEDMYVILNIHHEEWINRSDFADAYDEMSPTLIKVWTQIATYFADYDQHLIFEGMNEPRAVETDHEWIGTAEEYAVVNKLDADFVNTVRNIDSPYKDTRLLMIPSYCASAYDYVYSYLEVPDDDYVAVSLHAYAPYDFTMNTLVDDSAHEEFTAAYASALDSLFNNMRTYFTDKDIPVVIGEFSASNFNNTDARCEWAEYYISETKKYGIPCVLWDNNCISNASDPSEAHGYINRRTLEWYSDSEPVVDTMISVINDDSIVWGNERKSPVYTYQSIDSGKTLYKNATGQTIDVSVTGGNCTANYDVSWSTLENKDVAIKFTGDTPILAFMDENWENWTEFSPYNIDTENGIAYYSYDAIKAAWTASTEPVHLCSRTNGVTTITQIALIDQPEVTQPSVEPVTKPSESTDPTEPTTIKPTAATTTEDSTDETDAFVFETKKYTVTLTGGSQLALTFKGEGSASIGGCVGYAVGKEWNSIEWNTSLDADGNAVVYVDISDIPDDVASAEVQIWWSNVWDNGIKDSVDTDCELTNYEISSEVATDGILGDVDGNGSITVNDAVIILSYVANSEKYPLDATTLDLADVYSRGDGVSNNDALSIQKYCAQVLPSLPESYLGD
jgi:aryl-phospho-beta-D-glucosidase BglC (GH1 family)